MSAAFRRWAIKFRKHFIGRMLLPSCNYDSSEGSLLTQHSGMYAAEYRTAGTRRSSAHGRRLTVGLSGPSRYGCVALFDSQRLLGVCEQQRVTRVRGAGFNPSGLPDEALDTLLERHRHARDAVTLYAIAEPGLASFAGRAVEQVDHHLAHACAAYLSSPFSSAAIVVCDHDLPKVSVWEGRGAEVTRVQWPWEGPGFADLYSACAGTLGFASDAGDQHLEALARLRPGCRDARLAALFKGDGISLTTEPAWQGQIEDRLPSGEPHGESHAAIVAALQGRIGERFLEFLTRVARHTACTRLCLAGSFFYHSSMNTLAKCAGLFSEVFVPIDPENPGLAVGTALHVNGCDPRVISPFLGPAYEANEIKETLDNCKLRYDWKNDEALIETAVNALRRGALVGWFEGPMEWGARALGGRSILAIPAVHGHRAFRRTRASSFYGVRLPAQGPIRISLRTAIARSRRPHPHYRPAVPASLQQVDRGVR